MQSFIDGEKGGVLMRKGWGYSLLSYLGLPIVILSQLPLPSLNLFGGINNFNSSRVSDLNRPGMGFLKPLHRRKCSMTLLFLFPCFRGYVSFREKLNQASTPSHSFLKYFLKNSLSFKYLTMLYHGPKIWNFLPVTIIPFPILRKNC